MAKSKQRIKLQKRDWVTIGLVLVVAVTNWMWYLHIKEINKALEFQGWNDYKLFVQHSQLHLCFEQNTRPCDTDPPDVPQPQQ